MTNFAKLFESEKYGQISVIQQEGESEQPEVRFFFKPDGLGVCSIALSFDASDTAWDSCDTTFNKVDLGFAERTLKPIYEQLAP